MYRIYESHKGHLPRVRIRKAELTDFKGVEHGEIEFNCFKDSEAYKTGPDILALYGENGSGKSSFIDALNMLKGLLSGYKLGPYFTRFIDVLTGVSRVYIEFEFCYEDTQAIVSYEVTVEKTEKADEGNRGEEESPENPESILYVYDEIIRTNLYEDGSVRRLHSIIDTKNNLLCGDLLEEYYYDKNDEDIKEEIRYFKRKTKESSKSFVFSKELSDILNNRNTEEDHSRYYDILSEISMYASEYLYVVGMHSSGIAQAKIAIPLFLPHMDRPLIVRDDTVFSENIALQAERGIERINIVINSLIPELTLSIKKTETLTKDLKKGYRITLTAKRGEREYPLEYESSGIVRMVSFLADYIYAFNQDSTTLVIDELDSGIFELLIGYLLKIFEEAGMGQLIFTAHNLRPLECIDKKFIRFTTSDPKDRYYRIKNVGQTNNLRDKYMKMLEKQKADQSRKSIEKQKEEPDLYSGPSLCEIKEALEKAGEDIMS